jgi:hypothetical protein
MRLLSLSLAVLMFVNSVGCLAVQQEEAEEVGSATVSSALPQEEVVPLPQDEDGGEEEVGEAQQKILPAIIGIVGLLAAALIAAVVETRHDPKPATDPFYPDRQHR